MTSEYIKKAVDIAQRAQRNYDLSRDIPTNDLDSLIYVAKNSPSRQNETHYSIYVYTDQNIIRQIYNATKKFTVKKGNENAELFRIENGSLWQDEHRSVHNSQILANVLFVYVLHEGPTRCGEHELAKMNRDSMCNVVYNQQKILSIGISVGELILSATLMGYKTGICAAFDVLAVKKIIKADNDVQLLVGIGYENANVDRRLHGVTLNSELPEASRNGPPNEPWRFPSFDKGHIEIYLNGQNYSN
jgi:nitroreductase